MIEDPEKPAWAKVLKMDITEDFPEEPPAAWSTIAAKPPRVLHTGASAKTTAAKYRNGPDHVSVPSEALGETGSILCLLESLEGRPRV